MNSIPAGVVMNLDKRMTSFVLRYVFLAKDPAEGDNLLSPSVKLSTPTVNPLTILGMTPFTLDARENAPLSPGMGVCMNGWELNDESSLNFKFFNETFCSFSSPLYLVNKPIYCVYG
jgi:hypothetical protein